MAKTITYKGKHYPTRMFTVGSDELGGLSTILISVQSLQDALGENKEVHGTLEEEIDSSIYFFVEDDKFNLTPEEICENHLDVPMKFLIEHRI
jgi:hypothetical protein